MMDNSWFLFAIGCSFFNALHGVIIKKLTRILPSRFIVWAMFVFAIPFIALIIVFVDMPQVKPIFWVALFSVVLINALGITLYVKALNLSPLSLTIPFLAFTPLFLIFTSNLMLGELPSKLGIFGIISIVIGGYFINIEHIKKGFFAPFKNIYREKGSLLMLIVAFIWSVTANIEKICVQASSPVFYILLFHIIFPIVYLPIMLKTGIKVSKIKGNIKMLILLGLVEAVFIIFQMFAIQLAYVSYVIAIKRAGLVFSIIFGLLFFKEKNILLRLAGALFIVLGVFFIVMR